jgi:hypothetical protein
MLSFWYQDPEDQHRHCQNSLLNAIMSQFRPLHILRTYFFQTHLNIINILLSPDSPKRLSQEMYSSKFCVLSLTLRFATCSNDRDILDFKLLTTVFTLCSGRVLARLFRIWEVQTSNLTEGLPQSLQANSGLVP